MEHKKTPKAQIIIVIAIIVAIFSYITCDILFFKSRVNTKVDTVTEKFDSLENYLDKKLPQIDSALFEQQRQFDELKKMTRMMPKE